MADRVRQVVKQTRARIFEGITQLPGKIVSLFEPHSEIIRKGKASKPTEFGKLVQITEAENQIVTRFDAFEQRPSDRQLLTEAVARQRERLGRTPQMVAADAGYYAQAHERVVEQMGVKWVAVPNRNTHSAERKKREKSRWFRKAQAWRGLRGTHQRPEETARIAPLRLPWNRRNETLGWAGRAERQPHHHRKGAPCGSGLNRISQSFPPVTRTGGRKWHFGIRHGRARAPMLVKMTYFATESS